MKQFITFLSLSLILLMASCSSGSVYIDNPTDKEISVSIDGKEAIKVAPGEYKKVEGVENGEHTLKLSDGEEVKFMVEGNGFINPTQESYVLVSELYSVRDVNYDLPFSEIEIGEDIYEGPYEMINDPFIRSTTYNYDLNTPFPEEITLAKNKNSKICKKIFRQKDFVKYFDDEYSGVESEKE